MTQGGLEGVRGGVWSVGVKVFLNRCAQEAQAGKHFLFVEYISYRVGLN